MKLRFGMAELQEKGFTLIEGLMALAIVSIFIVLFFSLNSYIDRSFDITNRQSDLQFYSRLAQIKLKNEIELCSSLEICSDAPTVGDEQKAIYVEDGIIMIQSGSGEATPLIPNIDDDVEMNISFEKITKEVGEPELGKRLLGFTITSSGSGDSVELESSLLIGSNASFEIKGETGEAILYQ